MVSDEPLKEIGSNMISKESIIDSKENSKNNGIWKRKTDFFDMFLRIIAKFATK